jgi:hypothetical protein
MLFMEQLFIKNIIDKELFNNQSNIIFDDLFNYYDTKETIISFDNKNNNDYIIIDKSDLNEKNIDEIDNIDKSNLNEKEQEDKDTYIKNINDELARTKKVFEYLIVNIDFNKILIPNYKNYDYSNIPNNLKSKIKSNNHIFDIKKFFIKNSININDFDKVISKLLNKNIIELNLNDTKRMSFYILITNFELYNNYNKSLLYSLDLLNKYPFLFRNKEDYLININSNYFNIINDKIEINLFNTIKNLYSKNNKNNIFKSNNLIISKNKNNYFEFNFK